MTTKSLIKIKIRKFWRNKAKRWLNKKIFNGFNGMDDERRQELINSLARTMYNINKK